MKKNLWKKVLIWCGSLALMLAFVGGFWYIEDLYDDIIERADVPDEVLTWVLGALFIIVWGGAFVIFLFRRIKSK